jgi:hypothetical protein
VSGFTHRDRRAHRDVGRAFWTVLGMSLALTGVALWLPLPYAGITAVIALGTLGAVYVGWADGLLEGYVGDLRRAQEGTEIDGFRRVEASSSVGLSRDERSPTSPSPHARRRVRSHRDATDTSPVPPGPDSDQP